MSQRVHDQSARSDARLLADLPSLGATVQEWITTNDRWPDKQDFYPANHLPGLTFVVRNFGTVEALLDELQPEPPSDAGARYHTKAEALSDVLNLTMSRPDGHDRWRLPMRADFSNHNLDGKRPSWNTLRRFGMPNIMDVRAAVAFFAESLDHQRVDGRFRVEDMSHLRLATKAEADALRSLAVGRAARTHGVDAAVADRAKTDRDWSANPDAIPAAIARFIEESGRTPDPKHFKREHGLPSPWIVERHFGSIESAVSAAAIESPHQPSLPSTSGLELL